MNKKTLLAFHTFQPRSEISVNPEWCYHTIVTTDEEDGGPGWWQRSPNLHCWAGPVLNVIWLYICAIVITDIPSPFSALTSVTTPLALFFLNNCSKKGILTYIHTCMRTYIHTFGLEYARAQECSIRTQDLSDGNYRLQTWSWPTDRFGHGIQPLKKSWLHGRSHD